MKKVAIAVSVFMTASAITAQKIHQKEVPAAVKSSFQKHYPSAKEVKWEKENTNYEAEFEINKTESSALFDSQGHLKELEQEIKTSELPKNTLEYCRKNFPAYKVTEAAKITDATGKITYEAELEKGKEHFDIIFDDQGNFLKKTEPSTQTEDKD